MTVVLGQQMEYFTKDLMATMARTKPFLILNPDETKLHKWAPSQPSALASVTDLDVIIDHLTFLMEADEVDIIFFLPSGPANIIKDTLNKLDILNTKIHVVIPSVDLVGIHLRLDSNLYIYEPHGNGVILYECYQVR